MKSSNTVYIEKLDHIRFFAAALIVFFHTNIDTTPYTGRKLFEIPLINEGHVGVPLFMIVSGMILSTIVGDNEINIKNFYFNRILRVYPLYIFIITLGYFTHPDQPHPSLGTDYLLSLLPIANLYRYAYEHFGTQFWSISVELQFYLIFPYLCRAQKHFGFRYLFFSIALMIFIRWTIWLRYGAVHDFAFLTIFGNFDIFALGMILGRIRNHVKISLSWGGVLLCLTTLIVFNFMIQASFTGEMYHTGHGGVESKSALWIIWPDIEGLVWAVFVFFYLNTSIDLGAIDGRISKILSNFGCWSYSIYSWQIVILQLCNLRFLTDLRAMFPWMSSYSYALLIVLPFTVLVSSVSYYVIEQPFLLMRTRYVLPSGNQLSTR